MIKKKKFNLFDTVNTVIMLLLIAVIIYPVYFTVIASLSDANAVAGGKVWFWPVNFTLDAYVHVFETKQIWTGYGNSFFYMFFGTMFNLVLTIPGAYALSKKDLPHRGIITTIFLFSMYFSGTLIPTYLIVKKMGLIYTRLILILLGGVSVYNVILTRTYFTSSIDQSLYESAEIDGASESRKFFQIALPLAKPIIAVITLYYSVGRWNEYYNALIYITDREKEPLQAVLRRILILNEKVLQEKILSGQLTTEELMDALRIQNMNFTLKYAVVFIASAPLLAMYPFIQKHFVKGMMVGSLKG